MVHGRDEAWSSQLLTLIRHASFRSSSRTTLRLAPQTTAAPLAGMRVLVTGGSSGIGRAIAVAAARAGADVALTYRVNERGAKDAAREIEGHGRRARTIRLDLSDVASIEALPGATRTALGGVDAWINNAGADVLTGPAVSLPVVDKLDLLMRVDLRGTVLASWQAAELMASQDSGGVIINMSWDHVLMGLAGIEAQLFASVKGGVLAFSKSLARTVAPRIRVNVLAPGWIETAYGNEVHESVRRQIEATTPLARWGTPDDVAGAAVYLASPAASFVTGQTMLVGGGVVM
jgi:3-oxoacyl-[acyl-carrier protein] reductase